MSLTQRIWLSALIGLLTLSQVDLASAQNQPRQQPRIRPGQSAQQPRPTGGRIVDAQAQNQAPAGPPEKFQLSPAEQKRVDDMLDFWQKKTAGIQTLSARFGRWVYNPVFGPKNFAQRFTIGEIRYAAVDKGMIKEDVVKEFDPQKAAAGDKQPYTEKKGVIGEHWVCTGQSVYEYDHQGKKLNEIKLPTEMQGKAIAEGPLPFMFGAKADTIKKRYWIREIPRTAEDQPYRLELKPKLAGENYSLIQIGLDPKKFLPTEMVLYELNKMGKSSYAFRDMQANAPTHKVGNFLNRFIAPKIPSGYELIVHEAPVDGVERTQPVRPRQAQGDSTQKR